MWVHATKSLPHDIENMYTLYTERTLIIGLNIFLPRSKKLWHLPPTYPLIHGIVLQDFVPHRGTRMWNMRHSVTLQVPYSWNPCMAEHVNTSQNIYHGRRDVWQQCDNKGTMRQVLQAVHFECPGTETPVSHSHTLSLSRVANGPVWMRQALKPLSLIHIWSWENSPFSLLVLWGVIRMGSPVWKCRSWKNFRTKVA